MLADNKLTDNSEWDSVSLAREVANLVSSAFDESVLGFSSEDLSSLESIYAEHEKGMFSPALDPDVGATQTTQEDVEAAEEEQESKFSGGSGGETIHVTCPHCGEDFKFYAGG